jgi:hypothetical protein
MNVSGAASALSERLPAQLGRLKNAFRIFAKNNHELRHQAIALREEVSSRWKALAAQGHWFPWPVTAAPVGTRRLKDIPWREEGMLSLLGYHVGKTQPTPPAIRLRILEYTFECDLPPVGDRAYFLEWGKPRTSQGLRKLANTSTALTRNAKRRDQVSYSAAINGWEKDLAFLRNKYYASLFHFEWPTTDYLH